MVTRDTRQTPFPIRLEESLLHLLMLWTPMVPLAVREMQPLSLNLRCPHFLLTSLIYYASLMGNCQVFPGSCVHDLTLKI